MGGNTMISRILAIIIIALAVAIVAGGCAPGGGWSTPEKPAGFFTGVWHGWIAPISLVWGLFNPSIRVYEPINTGWWYDFGFYIAIIGGFGGIAIFRKKKKKDKSGE
jgi:hypothetical protein